MEPNQSAAQRPAEEHGPVAEAPSPRAKTLRDEIFGSALTLDEAAYILSLDRTTVAKYLREKTLYGFQIGREWLIPEEELRAYVRRVTQGVTREEQMGTPREHVIAQSSILERLLPRFRTPSKHGQGEPHEKPGKSSSPERMIDRFDRFTDRARKVLILAQEEARALNHNYIGTEHLLLGLVSEGEGVAGKVLANLGVELYRVRSAVEFIIGRGNHTVRGEIGLTPRSKKVMELAVAEAERLGHHYIGTEHLLLGMVREGQGIAAGVLESLNVNLERVRTETIRVLSVRQGMHAPDAAVPEPLPGPIPPEAASLVDPDQPALNCLRCDARNPRYFRHCFNCGAPLQSVP